MTTEECAICGNSVPFATTTHVLVNPKHEEEIADHYVCRPCYDEHLEGLFAALEEDVAILRDEEESPDEGEESEGDEAAETGADDTGTGDGGDGDEADEVDGAEDDAATPIED